MMWYNTFSNIKTNLHYIKIIMKAILVNQIIKVIHNHTRYMFDSLFLYCVYTSLFDLIHLNIFPTAAHTKHINIFIQFYKSRT